MKKRLMVTILVLLIGLSGCDNGAPKCDNSDGQEALLSIIKQNGGIDTLADIIYINEITDKVHPETSKLRSEQEKLRNESNKKGYELENAMNNELKKLESHPDCIKAKEPFDFDLDKQPSELETTQHDVAIASCDKMKETIHNNYVIKSEKFWSPIERKLKDYDAMIDEIYKKGKAESKKLAKERFKDVKLVNIRTNSSDDNTKSCGCVAKLDYGNNYGTTVKDLDYSFTYNSDGDIYAEFFGYF